MLRIDLSNVVCSFDSSSISPDQKKEELNWSLTWKKIYLSQKKIRNFYILWDIKNKKKTETTYFR